MTAVLAGAAIGEHVARHGAETKGVVEFAIDQQFRLRGHYRTAELDQQAAVKIEPRGSIDRFTWRVSARSLMRSSSSY